MRRVVRAGFGRAHIAREVDDELAFHLEMRVQKLIGTGLAPEAARQEALRQFGDLAVVRDYCVTIDHERERAMRRANLLDELRQDLVYAVRMLRRNVGFTAVVILTLALGIGANGAIFTLVDAVLLHPLPVRSPNELVAIGDPSLTASIGHNSNPGARLFSYPLYKDLRDRNHLVTGLLASGTTQRLDVSIERGATTPEHPRGRFVSGNYFHVLGVPAFMGRTFDDGEDRAVGGSPVIVISHGWWTRRFDRDPFVIGRNVVLDGLRVTIVGIASPSFTGDVVGEQPDVWIPITMQEALMPNQRYLDDRQREWLLLLGRRLPGVSLEQARTGFGQLIRQLLAEHATQPGQERQVHETEIFVTGGERGFSEVRQAYASPLLTLMAGVALLMLIICGNVATLLLARATARAREIGVRLAVGARRARLIRQLLTESLMLALLGAAAGLLLAWWGSQLLLALAAADGGGFIGIDVRPSLPVLGFTVGIAILSVALFGLAPALRASRVDLASTMRANVRSVHGSALGARGQRLPIGKTLIAGQVALSLVLLVGAALLVRSMRGVERVGTGLDRDHLLIVEVDAQGRGYHDARRRELLRELTNRFQHLSGVAAVTYSENGIFSGTEWSTSVSVPGFAARTHEDSSARTDQIGPGYVRAIGARLLEGREFTAQDDDHAPPIAILNESMARFYFPRTTAVGNLIIIDDSIRRRIVGVVADVKDHHLVGAPTRRFYVPYLQKLAGETELRFELRAYGDPGKLAAVVRAELRAVNPLLAFGDIDQLTDLMHQSIREERLLARLATGFGVLALLLAAIGLYGVLTYAITRRTGEIGLRAALGATRGNVIGLVLGDALRVVALGAVVGVPLAVAAARLLQSQLHGIAPTDPVSVVVALLVLGASATLAALVPALRAARVAPIVALRQE